MNNNNQLNEYQENDFTALIKKIDSKLPGLNNARLRAKLKMDEVEKILNKINNENS